jgi:glutaredoxin
MDKVVVLFTMKGCPYCEMMKEQLNELQLEYVERDINEHEEEYDLFVEVTENDYVPAFMIIESPEENPKTHLFAPERDFNEIEDGVKIIKEHLEK